MNPLSIILGGGVHGKACWLIAYIPKLTVGDITNVISSLNKSSAGYDVMPVSLMKKCIAEYVIPITYLVNSIR